MRLTRRAFVAGSGGSLVASAFSRSAFAGAPFAAWHDRTIANHRDEYAKEARNGLGLISFCLYGERGSPLCAAVMAPRPGGIAEEQRLGFSAFQWPLLVAEMASRGFGPTIVTATGPANDPVMAAVFRPMAPLAAAQINLSADDLRKHNDEANKRGANILSWFDSYGTGNDERFIAVWSADPERNGWLCGPVNEETAALQARTAALAPGGVRLAHVAVTPAGRNVALLVERGSEPPTWHTDMSSAQYQSAYNAATSKGLMPVRIAAKGSGNGVRFAAVFSASNEAEPRTFRANGPVTVPAIDAAMEAYVKANGLHQTGLAIVDRTRLVYAKGYTFGPPGYPDATPTTLFRQASVSKVFVALALYQLMQERPSLTLDTKLQSILNLRAPGNKPPADPRFGEITLRHLIESTSSLDNGLIWRSVDAAAAAKAPLPAKADQLASFGASLPLIGPPGDPNNVHYSNAGYFMASRVIAHLRGAATFAQALAPLLRPLEMTRVRTATSLYASLPADEARSHIYNLPTSRSVITPDRLLVASQYGGSDNAIHEGSGGLAVAVTDIARIAAMLAVRENNPVFKPATLDALLENAATATKTLKGPEAHGYHGFDYVRKVERPRPGYRGGKGGYLSGNQSAILFYTAGFSYVIAINGNHREGAVTDWDKQVAAIAEKYQWPAGDLFPTFGMRTLAT